jgi:regulator of sigma E protease
MISILITILTFLFTISLLVFIHEGGHYLAAKRARVWVHEFAIGFGPALWKRKWGETQYALRILPLGGFVRLAGEDAQSEEDQQVPPERFFSAKSPLTRIGIVLAGPLANIVMAVLLMIAHTGIFGVPYVRIAEVVPGSAAQGVLESGDRLVQLNREEIYFTGQIQQIVQQSGGRPLEALIERDNERLQRTLTPREDESGRYIIGVRLAEAHRSAQGIAESVSIGIKRIVNLFVQLYNGLKQVITGRTSAGEAFRGPVGIANILGWSITQGLYQFVLMVALLNLVLGVFNLIPFPALDGSRILFALYEMVRGKPISAEKEGWVHYVGFIILMGLILLITWQDIQRLFRGEL